jgi:hypothetical protein
MNRATWDDDPDDTSPLDPSDYDRPTAYGMRRASNNPTRDLAELMLDAQAGHEGAQATLNTYRDRSNRLTTSTRQALRLITRGRTQ